MRAFMLRGQGANVMHWRVFLTYPTENDFRQALAFELEHHGIVFERKTKADGTQVVVKGKARERWVQVQETEIADLPAGAIAVDNTIPEGAMTRVSGKLSDEDVARIVDDANKAPPGTAIAGVGMVSAQGTGVVVNPGDRHTETLTSSDVGVIDASVLSKK